MADPLLEINHSLGNIEGKLDMMQEQLEQYMIRHEGVHLGLDRQVEELQADMNKAKGASTIVGVGAGMIGAAVALVTKHFWNGN